MLKSIPGASTFSALVILAEIGDVNRFPDEKKNIFICWLSSKYLRWILVECARIHVRKCDSKITEFYRKLKRKGKHENVAIIGVARKLLQTVYYMLKKGESFQG